MKAAGCPPAAVMNMYYTGLGIARSLGRQGVQVTGLSARRDVYGNFTRYARTRLTPDSKTDPEGLLAWLIEAGRKAGERTVLFPTRDDDVVFLDRFRHELEPWYIPVVPPAQALACCLDKWRTFQCARAAGVPTPECWLIEREADLDRVAASAVYPCVLKPVAAWEWRTAGNWQRVGARKAIGIANRAELEREYRVIARAGEKALVQEMVPGGDDHLVIAACYFDANSRFVAGFNTQKLVQTPQLFGTGCIVQAVHRPELFAPAVRLLESIGYRGIAEVEFKWDAGRREYRLIEVNPRPWDQHRLGYAVGTDLMYLAYCDYAGLPLPAVEHNGQMPKWIAEDAFILAALQLLWRRDPQLRRLFGLARGQRTYAMWSARDPLPALVNLGGTLLPGLAGGVLRRIRSLAAGGRPTRRMAAVEPVAREHARGSSHG